MKSLMKSVLNEWSHMSFQAFQKIMNLSLFPCLVKV